MDEAREQTQTPLITEADMEEANGQLSFDFEGEGEEGVKE